MCDCECLKKDTQKRVLPKQEEGPRSNAVTENQRTGLTLLYVKAMPPLRTLISVKLGGNAK